MTTLPLIRVLTPADQATARALILEGLGERFGFVDETRNPDVDDLVASYLAQGHLVLVAVVADALAGAGALIFEPDGVTCQLVRVSVRRDLRRLGIARALITELLARARERGRRRIWVETDEPWRDAIALYERLGFVEYARRDGLVFLDMSLAH
jgi:ribosomal protein S18 acetylase RimI-like enzyme